MNNSTTPEEVYQSICDGIQKLIEKLESEGDKLSEEEVSKIVSKISNLNNHLSEISKRFKKI